jgi:YD repeat-containing protein
MISHISRACKIAILAVFALIPSLALADYSWSWWHGNQDGKPYKNARTACEVGVSRVWYHGYNKRLIDTVMAADGRYANCVVELQPCKTCAWVRPDPNWIEGWHVIANRVGTPCFAGKAYDKFTGECFSLPGASAGEPPKQCETPKDNTGNPIYFSTGNKYQHESYFKGNGVFPLEFYLTYNSYDKVWRHNYSTRLRPTADGLALVFADGRSTLFSPTTGLPLSVSERGQLEKNNETWTYLSPQGDRLEFNKDGRIVRQTNLSGNVISFIYGGFYYFDTSALVYGNYHSQQTITVSNQSESLTITEVDGLIPTALSAGGFTASFWWGMYNKLTKARLVYASGSNIVERLYHYESALNTTLLTGITDERGVRYATWTYDSQGRAISSEHTDGADKVLVSYNADGSSTVTNELGKKATYRFQAIDGIKRITAIEGSPSPNCPNSNSTFTYDTRGLLKTKTDNKGHLTTYSYNTRGLEVSRTEASGTAQARTITTEWHPTLFLPLTVTEPTRITTYTYDAQGRQLSQAVTPR